ncbi:MAG: mannitol dehydrogenase family protein, partial [Paracoccaceae bacterium]
GFILPTLRDALAKGDPSDGLILSQAIWARMCEGTREDGTEIAANDPIWDSLRTAARAAKSNPQAWLDQRSLYGDLADNPVVQTRFAHWLSMIWASGLETTLQAYLKS